MSAPTTSFAFSGTTPAAASGYQLAVPQSDNGTPQQLLDFAVPNTGGVSVKTADYTLAAGDCGKLVVLNSAAAHTFTLPATPPSVGTNQWQVPIATIGAGPLTLAVTSPALLDGGSASVAVAKGLTVSTDGANYFTSGTRAKARSVTFKLTAVGPSDPIVMNYGATVVGWSIIGNSTFTASVDVWFIAGSAPPSAPNIPAGANKISASAPVALTSAQTAAGGASAISTWTTAITQWGTMMANATVLPSAAAVMVQIFLVET